VLKRLRLLLIAFVVLPQTCHPQLLADQRSAADDNPVFRPPFVLKLRIDGQHFYEEKFKPIPYVADGAVYLFSGEAFGINLRTTGNQVAGVVYQPEIAKAEVGFEFKQQQGPTGPVMVLIIRNALKRTVLLDALMTVPGEKDPLRTDVLPVEPGRSNTESWPHPIVQLMLRNFRFSEKPKGETETVDPKIGASNRPKQ
jgi:hypothetical protein